MLDYSMVDRLERHLRNLESQESFQEQYRLEMIHLGYHNLEKRDNDLEMHRNLLEIPWHHLG